MKHAAYVNEALKRPPKSIDRSKTRYIAYVLLYGTLYRLKCHQTPVAGRRHQQATSIAVRALANHCHQDSTCIVQYVASRIVRTVNSALRALQLQSCSFVACSFIVRILTADHGKYISTCLADVMQVSHADIFSRLNTPLAGNSVLTQHELPANQLPKRYRVTRLARYGKSQKHHIDERM